MGERVLYRMRDANDLVQRAGPYLLLEVLLPGGTLFALFLYLFRRVRAGTDGAAQGIGTRTLLDRLAEGLGLRLAGAFAGARERDGLEPLGLAPDC
jgi:hypothetical protein